MSSAAWIFVVFRYWLKRNGQKLRRLRLRTPWYFTHPHDSMTVDEYFRLVTEHQGKLCRSENPWQDDLWPDKPWRDA